MTSKIFTSTIIGIVLVHCSKCASVPGFLPQNGQKNQDSLFDIELLQRSLENTYTNALISPLSLKIGLGMIMEGALGETASEIRKALKLPSDPDQARNEIRKWMKIASYYHGFHYINEDPQIVSIANRIFVDRRYTIRMDYRRTLQEIYHSDVMTVNKDYRQETADRINQWVNDETNGLITSMLTEKDITHGYALSLVNAVYFKGNWMWQFKKEDTRTECFYTGGGVCADVEMMAVNHAAYKYAYIWELTAKVLEIPYMDPKHSMLIILPQQKNGIDQVLKKLNRLTLDQIVRKLFPSELNLKLPKFRVEYRNDMIEIFKSFNLSTVFTPQAQLHNMVHEIGGLHVSEILHYSKIVVDEEGGEAAAAIKSVVAASTQISFIADHPFIFIIKNNENNVMLFGGKYRGP